MSKKIRIDRRACSHHASNGCLVATPQQSEREVDGDARQESFESDDVCPTIVDCVLTLLRRKVRNPILAQDQVPHGLFLSRVDMRQPTQRQGAENRIVREEPAPVRLDAMLGVEIDDVARKRPAQLKKTAQLSARVIGDQNRRWSDVEWRNAETEKFVPPNTKISAAAQLTGTHARDESWTLSGRRFELKIARPDFSKGERTKIARWAHTKPRYLRTTG